MTGKEFVRVQEVNTGSTTDYPSLSSVFRLNWNRGGGALTYDPVTLSDIDCSQVTRDLAAFSFSEVYGHDRGPAAILLTPATFRSYRNLDEGRAETVFRNLHSFIGADRRRALCLGLQAGKMEAYD